MLAAEELSLANDFPQEEPQPSVGFDAIDRLPVDVLPDSFKQAAQATLAKSATSISNDKDSASIRRLLARELTLARVQLRFVEGLRNIAIQEYDSGNGSASRVKMYERLVSSQHDRMMDAITALSRLDPPAPSVRITAGQAAVVFEDGGS